MAMGHFENAALYARKPEFLRWCDNPEEPRDWAGAVSFLGLTGADAHVNPRERLEEIRTAIQAAIDWCNTHDALYLIRGGNADSPIHVSDLANLLDFLHSLTYRFPGAFDAKKGGRGGEDKRSDNDDEPFWDWD